MYSKTRVAGNFLGKIVCKRLNNMKILLKTWKIFILWSIILISDCSFIFLISDFLGCLLSDFWFILAPHSWILIPFHPPHHRHLHPRWWVEFDWCLFTIRKTYNTLYSMYFKAGNLRFQTGRQPLVAGSISLSDENYTNLFCQVCFPGSLFW